MRSAMILNIYFLLSSTITWAGGATSGGGHDLGLSIKRIVSNLAMVIESTPEANFPLGKKQEMLRAIQKVRVAVVQGPLPAPVKKTHRLQIGAAFSTFDGVDQYLIEIDTEKWPKIEDPIIEEGVLYHEIAVMAGLEDTSDYTYTDLFLKHREPMWRAILSQKFLCVVSLIQQPDETTPVLLGSQLIYSGDPTSVTSNWQILKHGVELGSDKRQSSIALQWVSNANGYLRIRIVRASTQIGPGDFKIMWDAEELIPQMLIHSPYDALQVHSQSYIRLQNGYQVTSSCLKGN